MEPTHTTDTDLLTVLGTANQAESQRHAKRAHDFLLGLLNAPVEEIQATVEGLNYEAATREPGDETDIEVAFAAAAVLEVRRTNAGTRMTVTDVVEKATDLLGERFDANL